jgi:hypothetical protein
VRATACDNVLLLLIEVPVPNLEEFACPRVIDAREHLSETAGDPAGLVDHRSQDVEDDHVDVGV